MDNESFLEMLRSQGHGGFPSQLNDDTPGDDDSPPSPPRPTNLGFAAYASPPAKGVMGFSPAGYQDVSPPVFDQFRTPPVRGSQGATQDLEGLNLSSSFESVSNVRPAAKKKASASTAAAPNSESTERAKSVPYSPEESAHLIKVWSSISEDPGVGDRQKEHIFWGKVVARYNATIEVIGYKPRNKSMLKGHYQRMLPKCNKFHGYYAQTVREWKSGEDSNDVFNKACEMYQAEMKQAFQYGKAYQELLRLPKYSLFVGNKKQKGIDGSSNSSNPDAESVEEDGYFPEHPRPMGNKKAVAQRKNKGKGKQAEEPINLEDVPEGGEHEFWQSSAEVNQTYLSIAKKKEDVLEKKKQAYTGKLMTAYNKLLATDTSQMSPEDLEQHFLMRTRLWSMIEK